MESVSKPGRFMNFACVTGMDIPFRDVSTLVGDTSCEVRTDYGESG